MKLNVRQQLYKKYRLSGINGYQSAIKAGYSHATAIAAYKNIEKRINFEDLMVKHGLTDEKLIQVVNDGLNAEKNDGKPDHYARHKFLDTSLKLKGKLKESSQAPGETKIVIIRDNKPLPLAVQEADRNNVGREISFNA